jgi:hypothetical protein
MGFRRVLAAACWLTVVASSSVSAQEAQRTPAAKEPESKTPASAKRLEAGPAPDDGIPVLVVDAESGEPVANALVTWFEENEDFQERVLPEAQLEVERIEHGRTVATDAKGRTKVARSSLIVASADGRYAARRWSRATESPMKFTLKRARRLDVVVVDEEKRPVAGAPLSLSGQAGSVGPAYSWQLATGPDGKASFAPLDLFLGFELRAPHELHLRVDAPLGESADEFARVLDDRKLPQEPVTFTLPPTGTLVVDVVDEKGAPVTSDHYLTIETLLAGTPDAAFDDATKSGSGNEWFCYDDRSHYELHGVALGRRIRIKESDCFGVNRPTVTVDGPTKAGEVVNARIVVVPPKAIEIVAIVVGPDGKPTADANFTIRLVAPVNDERKESAESIAAKSDAHGALKARLEETLGRDDLDAIDHRIATAVFEQQSELGVVAVGRCPFPPAKSGRTHDLGTVKLEATPLFLSGRVVDDAGTPVAHAKVVVEGERREEDPKPRIGYFPPAQTLEAECAADGTFEVRGVALPDADYHAKANAPTGLRAPDATDYVDDFHGGSAIAVGPGARDVGLVLWRSGTIAGTIVGDAEEIAKLSFDVHWKRADGEESGFTGGNPEAEFSLEGIPVGVATVKLVNGDFEDPVATFEHVVVEPGKTTRLAPLVLAAAKHVVALTIRDEAGRPIPRGWVTKPPAPDEEERFAQTIEMFASNGHDPDDLSLGSMRTPSASEFQDGELTLTSDRPFRALAVGAPGCSAVVLHDAEGAVIVTLRPAPKVELVLDVEGDAPADEDLIAKFAAPCGDPDWIRFGPGPMFHLSGATESDWRMAPVKLAPGKPVPFQVNASGKLCVSLVVGKSMGSGGYSGRSVPCAPRALTIAESRDLQVFHVRVSADALRVPKSPPGDRR